MKPPRTAALIASLLLIWAAVVCPVDARGDDPPEMVWFAPAGIRCPRCSTSPLDECRTEITVLGEWEYFDSAAEWTDEDTGEHHIHDATEITRTYRCSNCEHVWTITIHPRGPCFCGWGANEN